MSIKLLENLLILMNDHAYTTINTNQTIFINMIINAIKYDNSVLTIEILQKLETMILLQSNDITFINKFKDIINTLIYENNDVEQINIIDIIENMLSNCEFNNNNDFDSVNNNDYHEMVTEYRANGLSYDQIVEQFELESELHGNKILSQFYKLYSRDTIDKNYNDE